MYLYSTSLAYTRKCYAVHVSVSIRYEKFFAKIPSQEFFHQRASIASYKGKSCFSFSFFGVGPLTLQHPVQLDDTSEEKNVCID